MKGLKSDDVEVCDDCTRDIAVGELFSQNGEVTLCAECTQNYEDSMKTLKACALHLQRDRELRQLMKRATFFYEAVEERVGWLRRKRVIGYRMFCDGDVGRVCLGRFDKASELPLVELECVLTDLARRCYNLGFGHGQEG